MSGQTETGQRVLQPSSWPRPRGYANGIVAGGETIFLAGQVGWDVDGRFPEGLADQVRQAFAGGRALPNLLVDPAIAADMQRAAPGWRRVVAAAASAGVPVPALAASLAYFDSYRTPRLPQNLTQAQRDAFGAHTFERVEKPGFVHFDWGLTAK